MITTSTGAKKLESSDNWREIFPNPGTSAAGAHNASVDAQDRIQAEVAPIINGKRCSLGAASGEYVLLRNSTIAGKTDGAYQAAKAIPANTDLDSTYLGSAITGGLVNELNSNLTNKMTKIGNYNSNINISDSITTHRDMVANLCSQVASLISDMNFCTYTFTGVWSGNWYFNGSIAIRDDVFRGCIVVTDMGVIYSFVYTNGTVSSLYYYVGTSM